MEPILGIDIGEIMTDVERQRRVNSQICQPFRLTSFTSHHDFTLLPSSRQLIILIKSILFLEPDSRLDIVSCDPALSEVWDQYVNDARAMQNFSIGTLKDVNITLYHFLEEEDNIKLVSDFKGIDLQQPILCNKFPMLQTKSGLKLKKQKQRLISIE